MSKGNLIKEANLLLDRLELILDCWSEKLKEKVNASN
ncbi:hypothetical protein BRC2024_OQYPJBKP_CDS_0048 [Acinetobacter phage vB_AbaM_Highwayman]